MRSDVRSPGRLHGGGIEFSLEDEQDVHMSHIEKALYARKEVRIKARRHREPHHLSREPVFEILGLWCLLGAL